MVRLDVTRFVLLKKVKQQAGLLGRILVCVNIVCVCVWVRVWMWVWVGV